MRRITKILFAMTTVLTLFSYTLVQGQSQGPSDPHATSETGHLYQKLLLMTAKGTMVGHQDDLAYGHGWYGMDGHSDVKGAVGDYPAVIGWEIGDLELGKAYNLDSVYFDDMRRYIQQTYWRGGVTTISWHGNNIATGGNSWDCKQDTVVRSILPGGVHHQQYLDWLDRLGDFFLSLKDKQGVLTPIVFRPYHEHTGSWFWWGTDQCTPDEYKALWRMTVSYLQDHKGVHHILYCYSSAELRDEAHFLERYPGDDVVDIVGFDCYLQGGVTAENLAKYRMLMASNIAIVRDYAIKAGKLAIIGETGLEGVKYNRYFTEIIYPLIRNQGITWVLFWRNAYEQDKPEHFYVPYKGHSAAKDFKRFVKKKDVLMNLDIR